MREFLRDAAERIIVMNTVFIKVNQRYKQFLDCMQIPQHQQVDFYARDACKIISEFALEYRTMRERVLQTLEKKRLAKEKKRQIATQSAAKIQNELPRLKSSRKNRDIEEDSRLREILGEGIEVTDNGTLRRRKKHHRHHHKRDDVAATNGNEEHQEKRHRKSSRRHRSSLLEGTLPLTQETLKDLTQTEMERGLLETLMGPSDENAIKRNKERRRSIRNHDLKRSRTRDKNDFRETNELQM